MAFPQPVGVLTHDGKCWSNSDNANKHNSAARKKMNEFRFWLNKEIAQKRLAHAALFEVSTTYTEMMQLNELEDEIVDLRTALTKYLEFQRVPGARNTEPT